MIRSSSWRLGSPRRFRGLWSGVFAASLPLLQLSPLGQGFAETPAPREAIKAAQTPAKGMADWVADPQQRSHVLRLGVQRLFEQGFRGQGMKVAILDSGLQGYRAYLGKGLPSYVQ